MALPVDPFASAREMLVALRARRVSARELLELHLERIARFNPALNAVVILDEERARRAAGAADQTRLHSQDAPLLGLPYTTKDWIEVEGVRSTAGSPDLKDYVAQADAPVVARLRAAGGVFVGKTNMAPHGADWQTDNPVFGRSNNPWDLERTPGGSTGGGAAAVAAGLSPLEFGNDLSGSVRVPPAFCGIYGHRPSETLLPRSGQIPDPSGRHLPNPAVAMSVIGPLARHAADLELALNIVAGPEAGEDAAWRVSLPPARQARLADYRVAVMPPVPWLPVDDEILAAQERLTGALGRLGCKVREAQPEMLGDLRDHYKLYTKLWFTLTTSGLPPEARHEVAAWARAEAERCGDDLLLAVAEAVASWPGDYVHWFGEREARRAAFRAFFQDWDLLLSPVTMVNAFRHDDTPPEVAPNDRTLSVNGRPVRYGYAGVYASVATLPGQPATAFPSGHTRAGLPVGLQVVGPYLEDRTPIRFTGLVAQEMGGYSPPPGYED